MTLASIFETQFVRGMLRGRQVGHSSFSRSHFSFDWRERVCIFVAFRFYKIKTKRRSVRSKINLFSVCQLPRTVFGLTIEYAIVCAPDTLKSVWSMLGEVLMNCRSRSESHLICEVHHSEVWPKCIFPNISITLSPTHRCNIASNMQTDSQPQPTKLTNKFSVN